MSTQQQNAVDQALGTANAAYDSAIANIVTQAQALLDNPNHTRLYIDLGSAVWSLLLVERNRLGDSFSRKTFAENVRLAIRKATTIPDGAIRPADWVSVYWVALLSLGSWDDSKPSRYTVPQAIPDDWCLSIRYGTLAVLKALVEPAGDAFAIRDKCEGLLKDVITEYRAGKGSDRETLQQRITKHMESLSGGDESNSSGKNKIETAAKTLKAANKMVGSLPSGYDKAGLRETLEQAGVIEPPPSFNPKTVDKANVLAMLAETMTTEDAKTLVDLLARDRQTDVLSALAKSLKRVLSTAKEAANAEAAAA